MFSKLHVDGVVYIDYLKVFYDQKRLDLKATPSTLVCQFQVETLLQMVQSFQELFLSLQQTILQLCAQCPGL